MASYRSLTADCQPLETFRSRIPGDTTRKLDAPDYMLPLHLFQWSRDGQDGTESAGLMSLEKLQSQDSAAVRVVFAPPDVPHPTTINGMCELFKRHKIPSAFIAEGLQGVSQSFSARKDNDATYVWFHFLCKDITTLDGQIVHMQGSEDPEDRQGRVRLQAQKQSQENFTWLKPGFVLRICDRPSSPPPPSRTITSSSGSTLIPTSVQPAVEMFCFGAPLTLRDRFRKLKESTSCDDLMQNPYILLEIVLDEMYKAMDRIGWAISDIFGKIETRTLEMSRTPGKFTNVQPNFQGLHNLAKHTIYLRENCEAALATIDDLRDYHKTTCGNQPTPSQESTEQALKYQKTLFQSTQRRLESLDARISNLVQLSFHIVAQGDSRLMQSENQSMKTIAVMTLIFLPLSTVAGIFGTQFMKLDEGPGHHITVSQDFWLMWLIAVPLTAAVIVIWRVWYADAKRRLTGEIPRDAERYMGWKTLRQTLQGTNDGNQGQYTVVTREVSADAKV